MLIKMKLDDHWNPNLKVSNALLFYLIKISSALFFKSRKQAMARLLMRVRALFPIHFSAATFPFEEVVSRVSWFRLIPVLDDKLRLRAIN